MADSRAPRDEENGHDEREPLLPTGNVSPTITKPSTYHDGSTSTEETVALTEEDRIIQAAACIEQSKWTAWSIGFYVVLVLMAIFLGVIIILGSFKKPDPGEDNDDVEVCWFCGTEGILMWNVYVVRCRESVEGGFNESAWWRIEWCCRYCQLSFRSLFD